MRPLTDRQSAVLAFIRAHIVEHWVPPTLREIAAHMSIKSTNGVDDHLVALERKGFVVMGHGTARSLRIVHDDPRWVGIERSQ